MLCITLQTIGPHRDMNMHRNLGRAETMWIGVMVISVRARVSVMRGGACARKKWQTPPRRLKWQRGLQCRCSSKQLLPAGMQQETLLLLICRHRVSPSQIIGEKTSEGIKKTKKKEASRAASAAGASRLMLHAGSS